LNYTLPPNTIAFENNQAECDSLLATGRYDVIEGWTCPVWISTPAWYAFCGDNQSMAGVVFLHGRTSARGNRLVAVKCVDLGLPDERNLRFRVWVIQPASLFQPWKRITDQVIEVNIPNTAWGERATIFAGQPDPNDGSRFYIDMNITGRSFRVAGLLQPDDFIKLTVQEPGG